MRAMYMPAREPGKPRDPTSAGGRAIERDQIELLASQVSLSNQCGY